jgi:sugar phosphate permease
MKRGTDDTLVAAGAGLQGEDAVPANTAAAENEASSPSDGLSTSEKLPEEANGTTTSPPDQVPVEHPQKPELTRQESRADKFSKSRILIIMFSLCTALFLAALDVTIITTALPTIAGHFHASTSGYTWVGSAYLLANAASVPLWGKLSDIWGRKPMILWANIIFMAGSLIAALSNSIGLLIGGRVIQGIGGGGLVILVNICIADLFSMRDRPKYYGIVGMVWAIASGVGPVIGGVFTEKISWRWCFYVSCFSINTISM